jgi:4-amino-4-deoxychorismate lyase
MLLASQIDGQPAANLPVDDRGLAYGDGLFETMRVRAGRVHMLEGHLQRMLHGAGVLRLPVDAESVRRDVQAFIAAQSDAGRPDFTLKFLLTRGSAGRGYLPLPEAVPRRLLLAYTPAVFQPEHAQSGVVLFECRQRLGINPSLAGVKHLNRLEQVLARSEWSEDPRYAEGLVCDAEGRVVEGTMSNLCLVTGDTLVTPRLHRCGVAGVMRSFLLARALTLGIAVSERDVPRDELGNADEVFVCNSQFGIWPVREIGKRRWLPGALTRRLQGEVDLLWSR